MSLRVNRAGAVGRHGNEFSPAERKRALAEYSFLQDGLSFWLAYEYTPATAHANLVSAALTLYQGAINGGIVDANHLHVGGAVSGDGAIPPRIRPLPAAPPRPTPFVPRELDGFGGIINDSVVKIGFNGGIINRANIEKVIEERFPDAKRLPPNATTFDLYVEPKREAISAKSMNTLSPGYINNPERIFYRMKRYIDSVADYEPRRKTDLDPAKIDSKTIHLAIPEYTSPTQWWYLFKAIIYAKERDVSLVITRIRE